MISIETNQLLSKLNQLKTVDQQQNKKIRSISQNIIEYESKIKKWLVRFDFQLGDLDRQIQAMRESQKRQEQETIKQIDNYQYTLRNLLTSYEKQANKANEKLSSMVTSIKQEMKSSLKQKHKEEVEAMTKYKNMSSKLDKMIELVRSKQKKSIDDYQKIKQGIRIRSSYISQANQHYRQQVLRKTERLMIQLENLEQTVDNQLLKFINKYDKKVFEINGVINNMVQYHVQS